MEFIKSCNSVGKTPSAVAREIGLSKTSVTRWKNGGGISDANMCRIADYFGVSVDVFFDAPRRSPARESDIKIGEFIKKQRMALGWSQDELAQRMGYVGRSTISKIEAGVNDVAYSNILRFAEVFGTSVECLMGIPDTSQTSAGCNYRNRGTFAERLREALILSNKTQADLARETGIDKGSISNYLTGRYKPKLDNIHLIAEALGVNERWLMGYGGDRENGGKRFEDDKYAVFAVVIEKLLKMDSDTLVKINEIVDALDKEGMHDRMAEEGGGDVRCGLHKS